MDDEDNYRKMREESNMESHYTDEKQSICEIACWLILAIFFSGIFLLIGVGISYALFCN